MIPGLGAGWGRTRRTRTGHRAPRSWNRQTNERVPVLFASATRIDVLLFCALLKEVDVDQKGEHSWLTMYSFERLTAIPTPHPITELVSLASGKPLSADYRRPYFPCVTPAWVSRVLEFQEDAV